MLAPDHHCRIAGRIIPQCRHVVVGERRHTAPSVLRHDMHYCGIGGTRHHIYVAGLIRGNGSRRIGSTSRSSHGPAGKTLGKVYDSVVVPQKGIRTVGPQFAVDRNVGIRCIVYGIASYVVFRHEIGVRNGKGLVEIFVGDEMMEMLEAIEKGITSSVATCTMFIELGKTLYFSMGSEKNIKLTTTEDFEIFKALLSARHDSWLK